MTDLLDITAGRIVIRKPNGAALLDSAERMPNVVQTVSLTGITVDWPAVAGENIQFLPASGWYRHNVPTHNTVVQQVLTAYTPPVAPQFFYCRAKFVETLPGSFSWRRLTGPIPWGQWMPWVGSVQGSGWGAVVMRAMNFAVVGGNIVLEKRQAGGGSNDYDLAVGNTHSTWTMDLELEIGIIDA